MTSEPLDPAVIMAEHQEGRYPYDQGAPYCKGCVSKSWPCLPYRLAAELAAERERSIPEPLEPVQQAALDDEDWDYALHLIRQARDANAGYQVLLEDAHNNLAAEREEVAALTALLERALAAGNTAVDLGERALRSRR